MRYQNGKIMLLELFRLILEDVLVIGLLLRLKYNLGMLVHLVLRGICLVLGLVMVMLMCSLLGIVLCSCEWKCVTSDSFVYKRRIILIIVVV